jgi:hypothetical protein
MWADPSFDIREMEAALLLLIDHWKLRSCFDQVMEAGLLF